MPIGFSVRIMPGVRIRASTRGVGVGLGPRAARMNVGSGGVSVSSGMPGVHVSASARGVRASIGPQVARANIGSGGTSFSTGFGPFYASTRTNRGRSQGSVQRSLKAYEWEVRRARRTQEIADVARLEQRLISAHLEEFPPAQPPKAPAPSQVDGHAILRNLRKEALRGVPLLAWSARRAAKRMAEEQAERAIEEEKRRLAEAHAEEQAELDATWQRLLANDPQIVLAVLEEVFEDNQAPAAPVNCEGDETTIFMVYDSPDTIPDRKPALTSSGYPTLHRRNKTERNRLYATSMASSILATAIEAFAAAPGTNRVVALIMRKEELPSPARPVLSCLYCGRFERSRFERIDWASVDPLEEISRTPGAMIERKWHTAEVLPLNLSDEPDLAAALHTTADMLGCDANVYRRGAADRNSSTTWLPTPAPPASERVPFDTDLTFEELTLRARARTREVPEIYGRLLTLAGACRSLDPPVPEQRRGATYKQLAQIGHLSGMDKAERSGWYRVAKSIPLTELHALQIIDLLRQD
jgi:hypothetical protein